MLIFAHRGASKYAPESTLAAFRTAIDQTADGVEFDLQLTKDKVPVVIHDHMLRAFTTSYVDVQSATVRAIKTLDVGSNFGPAFAGEKIPTLEEVLTLLQPTTLTLNIELKTQPYWHFGLEERSVAIVRAFGMSDRVVFSSFSPWMLIRLSRLAPEIRRGLLLAKTAFPFFHTATFGRVARISNLHLFIGDLSRERVDGARTRGLHPWVWTVNTRDEVAHAVACGVDAIITDDPLGVRGMVDELGSKVTAQTP